MFLVFPVSAVTVLAPSEGALLSQGCLSSGSGQESFAQCSVLLGKSLEYSEPNFPLCEAEIVILFRGTLLGFVRN